jgi:hypothetical protein
VNIPLGGMVKCRRTRFPLVLACAITIHKSQGGTLDEVVFNYGKSEENELVYVAMSRVTSLYGLCLTNTRDDHKFYHGYGNTAPEVKEINDEYARNNKLGLPTLAKRATHFCRRLSSFEATEIAPDLQSLHLRDREHDTDNPRQLFLIVTTINAQSLVAHAHDLISDTVLAASDCLAISETWMDDSRPVRLYGF